MERDRLCRSTERDRLGGDTFWERFGYCFLGNGDRFLGDEDRLRFQPLGIVGFGFLINLPHPHSLQ